MLPHVHHLFNYILLPWDPTEHHKLWFLLNSILMAILPALRSTVDGETTQVFFPHPCVFVVVGSGFFIFSNGVKRGGEEGRRRRGRGRGRGGRGERREWGEGRRE
jgi:hypothetical protein